MDRRPTKPVSRRGVTLAIVLWAVVALGALALAASTAARIETILQGRYRDHAAALALAEAALAEAQADLAADPVGVPDSLFGALITGRFEARWETAGASEIRIVASGHSGLALRTIEARVTVEGDGPRLVAWREVW